MHKNSDNRMNGSALKNLQLFATLCGQKVMPHVVLVIPMWSEVDSETVTRREDQQKDGFWVEMVANGFRAERFDNTYKSAWGIIGELSQKSNADIMPPGETVDLKMRPDLTQAGVTLNKQLEKLLKDRKDAARTLGERMKEDNDVIALDSQNERKAQIEEAIGRVADLLHSLKIPSTARLGQAQMGWAWVGFGPGPAHHYL